MKSICFWFSRMTESSGNLVLKCLGKFLIARESSLKRESIVEMCKRLNFQNFSLLETTNFQNAKLRTQWKDKNIYYGCSVHIPLILSSSQKMKARFFLRTPLENLLFSRRCELPDFYLILGYHQCQPFFGKLERNAIKLWLFLQRSKVAPFEHSEP